MKKCLIIDDDTSARAIVNKLCVNTKDFEIVEEFSNPTEAINFLENDQKVDVVFLDIHMKPFSGFDFITYLKNPPPIVFTTFDKSLALNAYELDCVVDYLVKPIKPERFQKTVTKLNRNPIKTSHASLIATSSTDDYLYVSVDKKLVKIKISDIHFIEADGDYIKIKTEDKNHIVHATLKRIEEKLPEYAFLRVHRSYIVNTSKIIDIENNSLLIKQDVIPISKPNKRKLIKRLNLL